MTDELLVTKRDAASVKNRLRAELKTTLDDLDRRDEEWRAEGQRERDRFVNSPIIKPPIDTPTYGDWLAYNDWLDKAGDITAQRVRIKHQLEILEELPKPGRKQGKLLARADDPKIAHECLTKACGNTKAAMDAFIDIVKSTMSKKALENGSAQTTATKRWYQATEANGCTRRARLNILPI
jgi:hypothetical protein